MTTSWIVGVLAVALGACGSSAVEPDRVAVGTYIGGGSFLFGPSTCEYAGDPGVFRTEEGSTSADFEGGPRFIVGPGAIKQQCKSGYTAQSVAMIPTGVVITGPSAVKIGTQPDDYFRDVLVAGTTELGGEAYTDWQLGPDCNGVAEFAPVMGAQDTGGKDRIRSLVPKTKGTCTIIAKATVGPFHDGFQPMSFSAQKRITIQ
jgi:hypothetical protein